MSEDKMAPTFNMKVVVRETGIKPDTLRAWERRYGIPCPQRTQGGHRLYTNYEINLLKWIMARQKEGLRISRAIKLWKKLKAEGKDPILQLATLEEDEQTDIQGETLTSLREQWIDACLQFNEPLAQHILAQAFAVFSIETVCLEIMRAGISQIGDKWYRGEATVQQEHFASSLIVRQLDALLASQPVGNRPERIVVACPPYEQHTFSALLITLLLRRKGWQVVYLGANVPLGRMENTVQQIQPVLVILISQTLSTAGHLLQMANLLQTLQMPVAYGGGIFSALAKARENIPGYFLGNVLAEVPQLVENLLASSLPICIPTYIAPIYQEALAQYTFYRPMLESYVQRHIPMISPAHVQLANKELAGNIEAALMLGNMNLLTTNIDWVQEMLSNHHLQIPPQALPAYLQVYYQAMQVYLDEQSQPILDWFEKLELEEKP